MKDDFRYHRHNLIDWFQQEALSKARAAVIGAGAVGNEIIKNLALLGVGEIHIFDLDIIEEHNLTRSVLFRDGDIGQLKAEVAAKRAMELDSNVRAYSFHGDFWKTLSLCDLKTFDVLFCSVDNFEARLHCNSMCHLAGVDFVNTGIDSRSALIELFRFSVSPSLGCFECNLPPSVYQRMRARYSCGYLRKLSFIEKKMPTTIITSSAAGSLAVSLGLRLGMQEQPTEPYRMYLDTIAGTLTKTALSRAEGCPCCGRFAEQPPVVTCRPDLAALAHQTTLSATVITSDPILVGYRIAGSADYHDVFAVASAFNSDFPATIADDPDAVEIEIRDQFTMSELVDRFSGRSMPCKFAIVSDGPRAIVCEFEGRRE